MFTATFWAWGGKGAPALPKSNLPTVIRLQRSICQTRFQPPLDGDLHEMNVWLRRHRAIGRGDWDGVLEHILAHHDANPAPPAGESTSKPTKKLASTTAESDLRESGPAAPGAPRQREPR